MSIKVYPKKSKISMADQLQAHAVEFNLANLGPIPEGPPVEIDLGVSDQAVQDLKAHLDQVSLNGTVDARLTATNRIVWQLAHFHRNYGQLHTPVLVAETNVRFNDTLGAHLLALIYQRRGCLLANAGRIGRCGNSCTTPVKTFSRWSVEFPDQVFPLPLSNWHVDRTVTLSLLP